ncbi:MAG: DUF2344 domain-containing protein [Synergistetes bacterium]|nr:DUF2344 domain-containing protein [Synergistota bacterium]
MKLRLEHGKRGPFRFISHLDWLNSLKRAIRRAGLRVAYSRGFSPHMRVSLGPPLPVGIEGEREYFDIELEVELEPREVAKRLNAQLPEELGISRCEKAPSFSLMKFINFSIYDLYLLEDRKIDFFGVRDLVREVIKLSNRAYRLFTLCDSSSPSLIKVLFLATGLSWEDIVLIKRIGLWRFENGGLLTPFGEVEELDKYFNKR